MKPTIPFIHSLMEAALQEAEKAADLGEVPVGAVIAHKEQIIARAHNLTETEKDPTAHAEQLAMRSAANILGDWRLTETILAVTLEPCSMCAGGIKLARIPLLIFGAFDPRAGAVGSLYDISADERTGPAPRVIAEIFAERSKVLLQGFFAKRRA